MEIFWKTIAYYNSATWIYQLLIIVAGLLLTVMLIKNPRPWVKMGMKLYMIFLYLWIAIAYYAICCDERSYNGALAMFWVVMATIWVWDAITGYTTFERTYKYDILSYVLLILPFVYPLVSIARGLIFPGITSPVMPCSVTVFTIGLLLLFSRKVNMFLVLFLCHWSLIGLSKTYFFQMRSRLYRHQISYGSLQTSFHQFGYLYGFGRTCKGALCPLCHRSRCLHHGGYDGDV